MYHSTQEVSISAYITVFFVNNNTVMIVSIVNSFMFSILSVNNKSLLSVYFVRASRMDVVVE